MSDKPEDRLVFELSSTLATYQNQSTKSREMEALVDLSSHMISALTALRSSQIEAS